MQVAGTNGKGSVCAFLDSICREAEIKTGLYTSPHLVSITERIKIGGVDIAEHEFARFATRVRETAESLVADGRLSYTPTFFEQVTAVALLAFAEHNVDLAILETGLGGRFDAVTAAKSEIAAITRIDLDHQEYLGETIEEIAAEKAAIIHAGCQPVIGSQHADALDVLLKKCSSFGLIPKTVCEPNVLTVTPEGSIVAEFHTNSGDYWDACLGLPGRHQVENACVAIMVSELLDSATDEAIWLGLEKARHPGRLEYIGSFLLDGAHNPAGAQALRDYIEEFVKVPITLIFGAMRDKSVDDIARVLWPMAERLILTKALNSRSLEPDDLAAVAAELLPDERIVKTENLEEAIRTARSIVPPDGLIVVTGSLYLVGEAKRLLHSTAI